MQIRVTEYKMVPVTRIINVPTADDIRMAKDAYKVNHCAYCGRTTYNGPCVNHVTFNR